MLDDKINSMVFYHKLGLTTIDYVSCILYGQVWQERGELS
jgi:hypothetical protein